MGCDIHAHFEIKVKNKWHHHSQPQIRRNYDLFGKMAGVRSEVTPITEPKGLPKSLSVVTKMDSDRKIWDSDGHTHSWFDADEIKEIIEFHETQYDPGESWKTSIEQWFYLFGNSWDCFNKYREDYPKEIEDIRLVFWFDS